MTEEAKRVEVDKAIEYLREDACVSCIFNSFIGECTSILECRARKAADLIEALSAELEQVKRERDAAVEDLRCSARCIYCEHYAKSTQEEPCNTCMNYLDYSKTKWQWRGVKNDGP